MWSLAVSLRDVWLIGWFDVRESLRSRRALTLVALYLFVSTLAAYSFVRAVEAVESKLSALASQASPDQSAAVVSLARSEGYRRILEVLTLGDGKLASYLASLPPIGLFVTVVMLSMIPWLVALTAADQVAADLHFRTVRFVVLRTSRGAFVLGKLLSQVLLLTVVTVAALLPSLWLGSHYLRSFDGAATLSFLAQIAPSLLAYAFAFLGLTSLASQLSGTPGRARALTLLLFALLWLAGLSTPSLGSALGVLAYLSPWQLKMMLLAEEWSQRSLAIALCLGFGLAFTAIGYLIFRRRDL
jgi:ABC-type transport system involved in multi-copper enzyme maturation permease subunit